MKDMTCENCMFDCRACDNEPCERFKNSDLYNKDGEVLKTSKIFIRYICKNCGAVNTIRGFWKWFSTPHFGTSKLIKCQKCSNKNYMKRVDGRKYIDWPTERKQ